MNARDGGSRLQVVKRLPFGVELSGDLKPLMSDAERQRFRDLFNEHGLLVFRDQHLTHEEQHDLMSCIAPVPDLDGMGHVSLDAEEGMLGGSELVFHSDSSWSPNPYLAISLLALDVIDGATSTRFASNTKGLAGMPADFRARLDELRVTEVHPFNKGLIRLEEETLPGSPECTRPAILAHRETGVAYVYVTRMSAKRIDGLSKDASDDLIRQIFDFIYTADNVYEHRWHKNDLVIWDNFTVQHARGNVQAAGRRYLQRVACGGSNFADMYPTISQDPDYWKWLNAPDGHEDEWVLVDVFRKALAGDARI